MTLLAPAWLLLAVPLGAALWLWRLPSRWLLVLRVVLFLLVLLGMCGLALRLPSRMGTVVVVADRSLSMPPGSASAQKEAIDLIRSGIGADDRLAVVSFGRLVAVEQAPGRDPFPGFVNEVGRDASNLEAALQTALALVPEDGPGKIIVLSDGRWTGRDPAAAAARAGARGIPFDFRCLRRSRANDLAISRLDAPATVTPRESFLITAWVRSPVPQTVTFELKRGRRRLTSGRQRLASGLNRLTFRDRAGGPGTLGYTLTVSGAGPDPVPENNSARLLIGVRGPRPLLLVTASLRSGLIRLLRAGGLEVKAAFPEDCNWSLEELSKYSAVVLENVPAEKIGQAGMETLAAWVRDTGAGLMMTGGRQSYAPGGYYRSPLESVLPVSMELRGEHRKLAMAIVVALDRSGSMAVPVGGGKVKMDLANLGTAAVLDLLGPLDELGVIAVDTAPHVIHDLGRVRDKGSVRQSILSIHSEGGGIYVDAALDASYKMLGRAKSGTRHIILFADAADAERPGNYKELLDHCRKDSITVSVIGLGTPADKDAELLRDIARRGKGRCFFTDKPEELPRLFAQETFVVARSTFRDEVTRVRATPGLRSLTGQRLRVRGPIGGYNLCYLRPGARLATVTEDEYKAPVVAAWQAGTGRVLCYTGEADGKYTGPIARWKQVGHFFTSLARWAAGPAERLPENMVLTQEVKNGVVHVRLHLDPERKADPFSTLPRVTTLRAEEGRKPRRSSAVLHWATPDTLEILFPIYGGETAVTTVDVPGSGPVALPPVCLPYSPEFRPDEDKRGLAALESLARATGGKERVDLAGVWEELPKTPRQVEIAHWLLLGAVALLLLEVLERRNGLLSRVGWPARVKRLPEAPGEEKASRPWTWRRREPPVVSPPRPVAPAPKSVAREAGPGEPPPPTPTPVAGALLDALREARQRTRERQGEKDQG
jgi:uncharacterized membrane protein